MDDNLTDTYNQPVLELNLMRALHAVAKCGSVSAAAEALHITTSAVSQRLAKLEREVGQQMLERHGRGVRLTDAATLLAYHADRILSLVDEAEVDLECHRGAVVGRLSIAGFPTAARGLLPSALISLRSKYPHLRLKLREIEPDLAVPMILRGDVDIAVVQDWMNAPLTLPGNLCKAELLDDVADIAVPASHRFADRDVVELDELVQESWVSWPPGSVCHDWLLCTLQARGVEPRIVHTAAEHSTQLALVAAGFGVAVMPRLGRDAVPAAVRIVRVRPVLSRHVYAVWRAESNRRPAIQATVEALAATVLAAQADTHVDSTRVPVCCHPTNTERGCGDVRERMAAVDRFGRVQNVELAGRTSP